MTRRAALKARIYKPRSVVYDDQLIDTSLSWSPANATDAMSRSHFFLVSSLWTNVASTLIIISFNFIVIA
jgi:hypothetical protein